MSTLRVDTITNEVGTGAPDFPNGIEVAGASLLGIASQAEAEAGTDNTRLMTSLRTAEAITTQSKSMTVLGTLTTTSGSVRTISDLALSEYIFLYIVFSGVSINNNATRSITIGSAEFFTTDDSQTSAIRGIAQIYLGDGTYISNYAQIGSSAGSAAITRSGTCGVTNSSTSISVSVAVSSFDAGSITFIGVK